MTELLNSTNDDSLNGAVANSGLGINTIGANDTSLHHNLITDQMVMVAVKDACDFFGIPEVPVTNAEGTCVWPNDPTTYNDDVFGFNRDQLMGLGITGQDSLSLIYTHECAHRTLQGMYNDAWEEELACDFFAGVRAGMNDMNIDEFEASLGQTPGSASHPNGALRANFIELGEQFAKDMQSRKIKVTYDDCIKHLNCYLQDKDGLIAEYRERFDDSNKGLADTNTVHTDGEAKGFVDDREWHLKQAQYHTDRGEFSDAADHVKSAEMCSK